MWLTNVFKAAYLHSHLGEISWWNIYEDTVFFFLLKIKKSGILLRNLFLSSALAEKHLKSTVVGVRVHPAGRMRGGRNECRGGWRQNGSIKEKFALMKERDACHYKTRINTRLCDVPQGALFYSGQNWSTYNEVVLKVWATLPYVQISCVEDAHKIQWSICTFLLFLLMLSSALTMLHLCKKKKHSKLILFLAQSYCMASENLESYGSRIYTFMLILSFIPYTYAFAFHWWKKKYNYIFILWWI